MFCGKCGESLPENAAFCPKCGTAPGANPGPDPTANGSSAGGIFETPDVSDRFDPADIRDNKVLCILAYFGILFFIPMVAKPQSRFCRFHSNQGLLLLIANFVLSVVGSTVGFVVGFVFGIVGMGFLGALLGGLISLALSIPAIVWFILGLINAINGKAKELPIIGRFHLIDKDM